ncbi:MAG TPA: exopolyphosphatase, partial [Acidimicrobiaceae bacterium]|nr:exopolyphosphatase [Acidimicrobiaceae bacterium]
KRCRSVADAHGAELAAVATSAVREAENRSDFLDRAWDEAGVSVEVISGFE